MDPPGFTPTVISESQKQVQRFLVNIVSSFAASGQPRPQMNSIQFGNQSRSVLSDWRFPEKIISYFSRYLRLDTTCSMETNPELEREVKFWSEVGTV